MRRVPYEPVPARTILLVAHLAPPSPLSAARRSAGFAKYLARRGHRVVVLTSKVSGGGPIEGAARVVRTRDLMASRFNWRKGSFDALQGQSETTTAAAPEPSKLEDVVVPDLALVELGAVRAAARVALARDERPDVVWTTGPPPSTNVIGLALQRRLGLPWVADIRDGWRFERNHADFPLAAQRALDDWLDHRLTAAADRVTAVTAPIARDAHDRLGARHAATISNGFDLDELDELAGPPPPGLLNAGRHSLLYTGRLGYAKRSPAALLEGLRALSAATRTRRAASRCCSPARSETTSAHRSRRPTSAGMTRALGSLDRTTTMRLQRATDTLLLITTGNPSETGQKLFEYLAADRPVFVVGDRTEAARIVTRRRPARPRRWTIPRRSPPRSPTSSTAAPPSHRGIARRFHYAALAEELEAELEAAISSSTTVR